MPGDRLSPPSQPHGRLRGLDALRGVAALMVLLFHYTTAECGDGLACQPRTVPTVWFGYYGVELFFVISGLVIFWTLDRRADLWDFAASRFARLFPAYWAALLATSLVLHLDPLRTQAPPSLGEVAVNLSMLQTFLDVRSVDAVYWTLACELVFYAWAAVLVRAVARTGVRFEWFCLAWLASAFVLRLSGMPVPYRVAVVTLVHYGQFFVIGMCLFAIADRRHSRLTVATLGAAVAACLQELPDGSPIAEMGMGASYFPAAVACTALVWGAVRFRTSWLESRPLLLLGRVSYPLYLVHATAGYVVLHNLWGLGVDHATGIAVALALSLGLAYLIHVAAEAPLRPRLARLLQASRGTAAATPETAARP
jgi:peptidoglycan/LPS O-acetylase OafA/YrhL